MQPESLHTSLDPSHRCSGLLGQTYDGDGVPTHGKADRFDRLDDGTLTSARRKKGGTVTTSAMGEGALEGSANMYLLPHPFETNFTFSRFSIALAKPRVIRHAT